VDRLDDLGVVDPLEIDAGDTEVAVTELALDDDQRHAFARQLSGVRVAELVRREATTNAGRDRGGRSPAVRTTPMALQELMRGDGGDRRELGLRARARWRER
jgi:hypothetical protein